MDDLDQLIANTPPAHPGDDLDALIASTPAAPAKRPQVGAKETFVDNALSTLPLATRITDGISALAAKALGPGDGVKLTPQAIQTLQANGEQVPQSYQAPGLADTYRNIRDERRLRSAVGSEDNPMAAGLGKGTGIGLSLLAPLPKVTVGAGVPGRIASNMLTAGAYGGANALADGQADLTRGEWGQAFRDVAGVDALNAAAKDYQEGHTGRAALDVMSAGVPGSMATAGALSGAQELGRMALSPLAGRVRESAIDSGRKALTNGYGSLSNRDPVSAEAVEEAVRSGAIRAGGTTRGAFERLQGLTDEQADRYRQIVSGLEAQGVEGPRAREIAGQLMARGATLEMNTGANKAIPNAYMDEALNAENLADPQTGRIGLTQGENIKRDLQRSARYGRFEETPLNEARRDIASVYRAAVERAVDEAGQQAGQGSQVRALADDFVPVKQRMGRLLEAEQAAQKGVSRGAHRSTIGPMEMAAGAAEVAAGHPAAALPATIGMKLLRGRGPSTWASLGLGLSDALSGHVAPESVGRLGRNLALFSNDLRVPALPDVPAFASDEDSMNRRAMILALRKGAAQ